jgi:hypothetical protein
MATSLESSANPTGGHGGGVRGDTMRRRSSLFEGRFGRIFRNLPPASWPESALRELGERMTAEPERDDQNHALPAAAPEDDDHIIQDDEENYGIPAGYTYFGQFIDHDITFDPASSMQKQNDPDALVDFRTPRLDLDSMYGRGPDDQPYLYSGNAFRLGRPLTEGSVPSARRDLPRFADPMDPGSAKRALIGDKRNDENVIVSQFHATWMQFHNKIAAANTDWKFAQVQQVVRWHYQWLVLNDFLVKICGEDLVDELLPHRLEDAPAELKEPKLHFFHYRHDPFMPIEFSAAAYRFGHSMVRPIYRLNTVLNGGDNPLSATPDEIRRGLDGRFFIFAGVQNRGLNGFDTFPSQWAIDWSLFFDTGQGNQKAGKERVQPSYKIDTSLVNPLGFLPEFSNIAAAQPPLTIDALQAEPLHPNSDPGNLATRNLLRGMALQLPSGQAVADAMGVPRVPEDKLWVGKAIVGELDAGEPLHKIHRSFKGNAPLWYYILAETQYEWLKRTEDSDVPPNEVPLRLGTVGARIVAETLIGLVAGDGTSYLRQAPNWRPEVDGVRLDTVGALLEYASS